MGCRSAVPVLDAWSEWILKRYASSLSWESRYSKASKVLHQSVATGRLFRSQSSRTHTAGMLQLIQNPGMHVVTLSLRAKGSNCVQRVPNVNCMNLYDWKYDHSPPMQFLSFLFLLKVAFFWWNLKFCRSWILWLEICTKLSLDRTVFRCGKFRIRANHYQWISLCWKDTFGLQLRVWSDGAIYEMTWCENGLWVWLCRLSYGQNRGHHLRKHFIL